MLLHYILFRIWIELWWCRVINFWLFRSSAIPRDDNARQESNYEEDFFGEEEEVQEGSEGSSEDSDEDLDSPRFIRQSGSYSFVEFWTFIFHLALFKYFLR